MRLTYECTAAPENAADPLDTTCRRMLPHLLSGILGWRFADGDDGWSPRHNSHHQINLKLVLNYNLQVHLCRLQIRVLLPRGKLDPAPSRCRLAWTRSRPCVQLQVPVEFLRVAMTLLMEQRMQ